MYGYIYKTTNLINGKIYIGQHKSEEYDSSYYGSGKLIRRAIEKYGITKYHRLSYGPVAKHKNNMIKL